MLHAVVGDSKLLAFAFAERMVCGKKTTADRMTPA
jgi:hypothetical protein